MAALTKANAPTAYVTEIPGRFAPVLVVDKRTPASITTSSATQTALALLPRAETLNEDFQTPTQIITELATNFNVGEIDDLPENKTTLNTYDVGTQALSLICSKATPTGTTTFGFTDLSTASNVDIVRLYADPNGNVFYSAITTENVITEYGMSLKSKGVSMENFGLSNFNMLGFRGFTQTKAYVVQSADVTANAFTITMGTSEAAVPLPSSTIPSYWLQRGCINFIKIERYRAATGWTTFTEVASAPVSGVSCTSTTAGHLGFAAADLVAGDLFMVTYATWGTNAVYGTVGNAVSGTQAIGSIESTSIDTSDAVAVPTRLTPITISANNVARGSALDIKLTLKRERAEGIGDTNGLWGPPAAPEVSISLDVKRTDASLNTLMMTGQALGSDGGYTANGNSGDWFDPNLMARTQLNTAFPVVAKIQDPRTAGTVLKTLTCPTAVFKSYSTQTSSKSPVTVKYSGSDRVGNMTMSYTH